MSYFVVDVEADGDIPGDFSMIEFAAVKVDSKLDKVFYSGKIKPISDNYNLDALNAIGLSKEDYRNSELHPMDRMLDFERWVKENTNGRPIFISDNNGFDWMFICWYFHHFIHRNPFGWSSRRIGDLYCGMEKDTHSKWKHLRKTEHTHNPIDDAKGNAEALLAMKAMGLKISLT